LGSGERENWDFFHTRKKKSIFPGRRPSKGLVGIGILILP